MTQVCLLQTRAADKETLEQVTSVLEDLSRSGVSVVRTWAFADGPDEWNALQPAPHFFDERVFCALDHVIVMCAKLNLKILFNLTNFWPEYGGMKQYVAWSKKAEKDGDHDPSEFYQDPKCQKMYGRFIKAVLTRKNSISGIEYRNDPTILGWAPANEPRCTIDPGAKGSVVMQWAHATSMLIKSLDKNHLVFMDSEGFFGPSTPSYQKINPFDADSTGCDFAQDCNSPAIDVCCIHLYPDKWLPADSTQEQQLIFTNKWINSHLEIATLIEKPLVLTEFGYKRGEHEEQEDLFSEVFTSFLQHMGKKSPFAGCIFWMAAAKDYPHDDGYNVCMAKQPVPRELPTDITMPIGNFTREIIVEFCEAIAKGDRHLKSFSRKLSTSSIEELTQDELWDKDRLGKCTIV